MHAERPAPTTLFAALGGRFRLAASQLLTLTLASRLGSSCLVTDGGVGGGDGGWRGLEYIYEQELEQEQERRHAPKELTFARLPL